MTPSRPTLEALVDALAPAAGLSIDPAARAQVVQALGMAAAAACLVLDFPLDEAIDEPAPVFVAGPRA